MGTCCSRHNAPPNYEVMPQKNDEDMNLFLADQDEFEPLYTITAGRRNLLKVHCGKAALWLYTFNDGDCRYDFYVLDNLLYHDQKIAQEFALALKIKVLKGQKDPECNREVAHIFDAHWDNGNDLHSAIVKFCSV